MKLNEIMGSLRSLYDDWSKYIVNPMFVQINSSVAWNNYEYKKISYPMNVSQFMDLYKRRQYSFEILEDHSIIQLYYQFEKDNIISANLAFYKSPDNLDDEVVDDEVVDDEVVDDEVVDDEVLDHNLEPVNNNFISWIRIDYSPKDARNILHHDCHIHFSAFPNSRFPVSGVPNPHQFIELVMAMFYPNSYKKHRLKDDFTYLDEQKIKLVNKKPINMSQKKSCSYITHFRIPDIIN